MKMKNDNYMYLILLIKECFLLNKQNRQASADGG